MEKRRVGTREKEGARESERTSSGSFKGNVTGSIVVCVVVLYFISISHCKAVEKACKKKGGEDTRQDGRKARQMGSRGNYQGSSDGQRTIGWDQWQQKNGLCGLNTIAPQPFPPAGLNRSFFYFEVNLKIINQADSSHFFSSHLHFAVFLSVSLEPHSFLSSSSFFWIENSLLRHLSLLADITCHDVWKASRVLQCGKGSLHLCSVLLPPCLRTLTWQESTGTIYRNFQRRQKTCTDSTARVGRVCWVGGQSGRAPLCLLLYNVMHYHMATTNHRAQKEVWIRFSRRRARGRKK